jgi:hypothetical protein
MEQNNLDGRAPWWKFGYVWFVLSGPLIVVIASLVTYYVAVTRPDPVVAADYYRKGIEINKALQNEAETANMAPAIQARNHAQTGVPSSKIVGKP